MGYRYQFLTPFSPGFGTETTDRNINKLISTIHTKSNNILFSSITGTKGLYKKCLHLGLEPEISDLDNRFFATQPQNIFDSSVDAIFSNQPVENSLLLVGNINNLH